MFFLMKCTLEALSLTVSFSFSAAICGNPGVPEHGYKDGSSYFYPHVLKFGCFAGYTLDGSDTLTCQRDGLWDGTLPSCHGKVPENNSGAGGYYFVPLRI